MILLLIYIILFLYLIYFIWISEPLFIKDNYTQKPYYPFISIIISAKNESNNKDKSNLKALYKQKLSNLKKYEIIIANDKSTDNTLEKIFKLIKKIKKKISKIH
jgi:Glycosyltransferases, probably involved in cell wall biogenesis